MHRHFERMFFDHFGKFAAPFFGAAGAAGMRMGRFLSSDELQLVILRLLSEKPRHGYEIIKAIEEHTSGVYAPSPGVVYPALTYLEEVSYAVSQAEGAKKLFQITQAGSEYLEKNRERAAMILDRLRFHGEKMAYVHEQMEQEEAAGEYWAGAMGARGKDEWRELKAEFHEIRRALKSAIYEKLGASSEEKRRVLEVLRKAIAEIRGK
jgi:DNA-binding PadR family transcriptional regulator